MTTTSPTQREQIGILSEAVLSFTKGLKLWQLPIILPIMILLVSLLLLAYSLEAYDRLTERPGLVKVLCFVFAGTCFVFGNLGQRWLLIVGLIPLAIAVRIQAKGERHE